MLELFRSHSLYDNGEAAGQRASMRETRKSKVSGRTSAIYIAAMMAVSMSVSSAPVGESAARKVATKMLSSSTETRSAAAKPKAKSLQLVYKSSSSNIDGENTVRAAKANAAETETVYFYVFGADDNKGFVIVSADDRATPVLGYSEKNGFSAEDMPENLKWWLGEYAKQIKYAIDNNIEQSKETKQQWEQYLETEKQ